MDKPLLLLDVDGVLCPFSAASLRQDREYPGFEFHEDYGIHTSMAVADRIYRLMEYFDVHWCTGWLHEANEVVGPLMGLPQFPVVPIEDVSLYDPHWKWFSIRDYVGDRSYAFVDDEITDDTISFVKASGRPHSQSLWLPVYCSEGLNEGHVRRLVKWVDALPV